MNKQKRKLEDMDKYIEWIEKQIEELRSKEAFKNRIEPEFTEIGKKLIYFKCIKDHIEHTKAIINEYSDLVQAMVIIVRALNIDFETIENLKREGKIDVKEHAILSAVVASKYLAEYGINPDDE